MSEIERALPFLQQLPVLVASLGIVAYILGYLITKACLSMYGFSELPLIESRYLAAGFSFLAQVGLFFAIVWLIMSAFLSNEVLLTKQGTKGLDFQIMVAVAYLMGIFLVASVLIVLPWIRGPDLYGLLQGMQPFLLWWFIVLPYSLLGIALSARYVLDEAPPEASPLSNFLTLFVNGPSYLTLLILYFFGLALIYAFYVYGHILPAAGGGRPSKVRLIGTQESLAKLEQMGMSVDRNESVSEPVDLLDIVNEAYIINLPQKAMSLVVPKALADGLRFEALLPEPVNVRHILLMLLVAVVVLILILVFVRTV